MTKKRLIDLQHQLRSTVGEHIRSLREQKGLNQIGLADLMNVSRSTISKIENGKFSITLDYLAKLALYLEFEIRLVKNIKAKKE